MESEISVSLEILLEYSKKLELVWWCREICALVLSFFKKRDKHGTLIERYEIGKFVCVRERWCLSVWSKVIVTREHKKTQTGSTKLKKRNTLVGTDSLNERNHNVLTSVFLDLRDREGKKGRKNPCYLKGFVSYYKKSGALQRIRGDSPVLREDNNCIYIVLFLLQYKAVRFWWLF